MFLSFIKKDSTELDFIQKVKSRYPELPFNLLLGITVIYSRDGLKELNRLYELCNDDLISRDKVEQIIRDDELVNSLDFTVNYDTILCYRDLIHPRKIGKLSSKFIIKFAYVISKNNTVFKTNVSDLIMTEKNPDISVINTVRNRKDVRENFSSYLNVDENSSELITFSDLTTLGVGIVRAVIRDPLKTKSYKFFYDPNFVLMSENYESKSADDDTCEDSETIEYKTIPPHQLGNRGASNQRKEYEPYTYIPKDRDIPF